MISNLLLLFLTFLFTKIKNHRAVRFELFGISSLHLITVLSLCQVRRKENLRGFSFASLFQKYYSKKYLPSLFELK